MGYTTNFTGAIKLSRKLTFAEAKFLLEMGEDSDCTEARFGIRTYMQWAPTESLDAIVWDGNEKFYDFEACMLKLCEHLLSIGIEADGEIRWIGEDRSDTGQIIVIQNIVSVFKGAKVKVKAGAPLTMSALATMALEQITAAAPPSTQGDGNG